MKGIILAGGFGTRLHPLTRVTNKHLLPVYNKPMIYYPLETLTKSGIKEILIVCGPEHTGHFINLLRSGKEFGTKIRYEIQDSPTGIAGALALAEDFAGGEPITVVLGDNIFEDTFDLNNFQSGAKIFLKIVADPKRYGVAEVENNKIIDIEEKPENPKTNYAVTGIYQYDSKVFEIIKTLKPSERGELEISDVNNEYIKLNEMRYDLVKGFWTDAGTIKSLHNANMLVGKMTEE